MFAGVDINVAQEKDHGVLCLALVGFTEMRSGDDTDLAEVMHVVLERLKLQQERFGLSICEIAEKPGQFIGVLKLKYPRRPWLIEAKQWDRALDMADKVIAGTAPRDPRCIGATHFDLGGSGLTPLCKRHGTTFYIENTNQLVEVAKK